MRVHKRASESRIEDHEQSKVKKTTPKKQSNYSWSGMKRKKDKIVTPSPQTHTVVLNNKPLHYTSPSNRKYHDYNIPCEYSSNTKTIFGDENNRSKKVYSSREPKRLRSRPFSWQKEKKEQTSL